MEFSNSALPVRSVSEAIIVWVQEMFLRGELKPGERLPNEVELARMFKVSRGALREALSALKAKGLIEKTPGRGTFIRKVSRAKVLGELASKKQDEELFIDIIEVREVIEEKAIELALKRMSPKDLDNIRHALSLLPQNNKPGAPTALEADVQFHLSLALAAHNEILFRLVQNVGGLLQDIREKTLMHAGRLEECQHEHEEIFEALQEGDLNRTMSALKKHLDQVRKEVMS